LTNTPRLELVEPRTTRFHRQKLKQLESLNSQPEPEIKESNIGIQILEEAETQEPIEVADIPVEKQDTNKIDIDNYMFQSEFDEEETPAEIVVVEKDKLFKKTKIN